MMIKALQRRRGFAFRVLTATTIAGGLSMAGLMSQPAGAKTLAPLAVGDICSCTGPEASTIAQTSPTALAWASSVNAQGGIDGHKVEVIVKTTATTRLLLWPTHKRWSSRTT